MRLPVEGWTLERPLRPHLPISKPAGRADTEELGRACRAMVASLEPGVSH